MYNVNSNLVYDSKMKCHVVSGIRSFIQILGYNRHLTWYHFLYLVFKSDKSSVSPISIFKAETFLSQKLCSTHLSLISCNCKEDCSEEYVATGPRNFAEAMMWGLDEDMTSWGKIKGENSEMWSGILEFIKERSNVWQIVTHPYDMKLYRYPWNIYCY